MSSDVQGGAFNVQNIIPKKLITGRLALDNMQKSLVMWAKPLIEKNNYKELVDPCLGDSWDGEQMKLMAVTASLCIHPSSIQRPQMREDGEQMKLMAVTASMCIHPSSIQRPQMRESNVTVGRTPAKADLVIPVATVSDVHARIEKKEGNLYITDLDSTNGTFLGEKQATAA